MPFGTITTNALALRLAQRLQARGVEIDDVEAFAAEFSPDLTAWMGGEGAVPADLSQKVTTAAAAWNTDAMQRLDWWTGAVDGGPNGDGLYPMTNAAGVTTLFPSLAKVLDSSQKGNAGWSPRLTSEADGSTRVVLRVADWAGGQGTKPATGYIAADGSLVASAADGQDFFGPISTTLTGLKDAAAGSATDAASARDALIGTYGATDLVGTYPAVAGSFDLGAGLTVFPITGVPHTGTLTGLSVYVSTAGAATLVAASVNGDGTLKLEASKDVALTLGGNTIEDWNPAVAAGWLIGVYRAIAGPQYAGTSGQSCYYTTGVPGAATAKSTSLTTALRLSYRVEAGVLKRVRSVEATSTAVADKVLDATTTFGVFPPGDGANTFTNGITSIPQIPSTKSGLVTDFAMHSAVAAPATLCIVSINGDGTARLEAAQAITLDAGANTFSGLSLPILAGQYVGLFSVAAVVRYAGSSPAVWYTTGLPGTATPKTNSGTAAKMAYKVLAGLDSRMLSETNRAKFAEAAEVARATAVEASLQGQITGAAVQQGQYPATNQAFSLADGYTAIAGTPISADGRLASVSVCVAGAQAATLCLLTKNGSNQFSLVASKAVALVAGVNTVTWSRVVAAGQYVGVFAPGPGGSNNGVKYSNTGGPGLNNYYTTGLPGTDTGSSGLGLNSLLSLGWTLSRGLGTRLSAVEDVIAAEAGAAAAVSAETARATAVEGGLQGQITGSTVTQLQYPAAHLSFALADGYTAVPGTPISADGRLSSVSVYSAAAQQGKLCLLTKNGSNQFTLVTSKDVALVNGVNTFSWSQVVTAGQFLGVYAAGPGGGGAHGVEYATSGGPGANNYYFAGIAGTNTASAGLGTNSLLAIGWRFAQGVGARLLALEDAPVVTPASLALAGIGLLDSADRTGVADATAIFAAALASHPNPYVPPGNYSVTALPKTGGGLWGPGKIFLNGVRFLIPTRPSNTELFDGLRSALIENINQNDVLTVIGDSITHWAFAPTGPEHWLNRLTQFANLGIAADEPTMTALRPYSSYTPAFYGVTVTGTVSTGTNGPIGESLILNDGASLAFTGDYEQVDVFYTQQSGAGSLLFAYNGGAPYKTVVAVGATALDKYSGASDTGQTASGTYTLTASGGPVEITGLIRLGVKVAGARKRLRVGRMAHGGYAFSHFISAAKITSLLAQASYAGGTILPILALGVNDSFGVAPTTIVANATTLINALQAGGASRILALPPMRPSSSWDATYTSGRTYDGAAGPLRKLYREKGVTVVPLDAVDWVGEGLFTDGLHPGGPANDRMLQIIVEAIASLR